MHKVEPRTKYLLCLIRSVCTFSCRTTHKWCQPRWCATSTRVFERQLRASVLFEPATTSRFNIIHSIARSRSVYHEILPRFYFSYCKILHLRSVPGDLTFSECWKSVAIKTTPIRADCVLRVPLIIHIHANHSEIWIHLGSNSSRWKQF